MTAPTCSKCDDTGSLSRNVYVGELDCIYCEKAAERKAFNEWVCREFGPHSVDAIAWQIYQRGKADAAQSWQPVAWAFRYSTGEIDGFSLTEHSRGMIGLYAEPIPDAAPELATALRGLHGWAIEMLDMAEFKAWPDADRADFMLKMRAADELLKNYPREA